MSNPPFGLPPALASLEAVLRNWEAPPPVFIGGHQPSAGKKFLAAALVSVTSAGGWVFHYSGVLFPDSLVPAVTDGGFAVFDNFVWNPVAEGIYEAPGYSMSKDALVRAYATIQGQIGPNTTGKFNPVLQIRYSQSSSSDPNMWTADGNPMWAADPTTLMWQGLSPWQNWTKGQLQTTYVQLRVVHDFTDGLPLLQLFTPVVDQPFLSDSGSSVAISAGGTAITFANLNFLNPPSVTCTALTVNGDTAGSATASAISATGFTGHVFDTIGNDVGGTMNWQAHT